MTTTRQRRRTRGARVSRPVRSKQLVARNALSGLSKEGRAFLMCAFAAPDMTVESVRGIPDSYEGKSLLVKHRINVQTTTTAGNDMYYILSPIPGVAWLQAEVAAGTPILPSTVFYPVVYPDYPSLFPTPATSSSYLQSFRHVSNAFEIVPTVNQMTWVGAISVWKSPIRLTATGLIAPTAGGRVYQLNGLEACNGAAADMYVGPFINGAYTLACQQEPDFEFTPIIDDLYINPDNFGQLSTAITGFGNLESVIIKVSGQTSAMPCALRAWSCVEYLASPNSAFYRFAQASPCEDEHALKLYRQLAGALPIAVPYYQNDSFWDRVKGIIGDLTAYMAKMPGPAGELARSARLAYDVGGRLF